MSQPMLLPTELYGIIGYPLGHSQSPRVHNEAFRAAQLPKVYLAWPTPPEALPALVDAVRALPIAGLSVTIPHKENIIPLLDAITPAAQEVGAVNTLFWRDGALCGHNTDKEGFMAPLRALGLGTQGQRQEQEQGQELEQGKTALVLGAGGAARAVLAGLQALGYTKIVLTNHNMPKAMALAHAFQVQVVPWEERASIAADIIVNATPLGMRGDREDQSPYPAAAFHALAKSKKRGQGLAYDLVYTPLHTRFLTEARAAGWDIQDGLSMFVAQANEQFRLWTGQSLDVQDIREILLKS